MIEIINLEYISLGNCPWAVQEDWYNASIIIYTPSTWRWNCRTGQCRTQTCTRSWGTFSRRQQTRWTTCNTSNGLRIRRTETNVVKTQESKLTWHVSTVDHTVGRNFFMPRVTQLVRTQTRYSHVPTAATLTTTSTTWLTEDQSLRRDIGLDFFSISRHYQLLSCGWFRRLRYY